jgi:hydrogenase maturation protein HypF
VKIEKKIAKKIFIRGIVQGVGFRPTVYTYALEFGLNGWVRNTSSGVEILVSGPEDSLGGFIQRLRENPPPLAKVDSFLVEDSTLPSNDRFEIFESEPSEGDFLPISPDLSICPDCLRELFDPKDRRFRYPFINCTNCGPRYTIIQDIPYDRPKTTMAPFMMCPECKEEYDNPLNRRFHAQPVACPRCGPQVRFESVGKITCQGDEAIHEAREWIKSGRIVAIKGLGGYLLACDAANEIVVSNLRLRKMRIQKPFALMASDLEVIRDHCEISKQEEKLLFSTEAPIVLLRRKSNSSLPNGLAPGQQALGFMLPYTPLHHLLLEKESGYPKILVMTSGNLSEEPIAFTDDDARNRLSTIAGGFLMHNREINIRTDDSVVRLFRDQFYPIRRARGYAPSPLHLPRSVSPILGVGAELNNTVTLAREDYAFISHHIGDMENLETTNSFNQAVSHFELLFRVKPESIACDLHPDYRSSIYATERACAEDIPLVKVQHHHAHLAACLADNHWQSEEPVIGVCFDGTGLGTDGAIWGGEFLLGGYSQYSREYHLSYIPLPGGDAAISKPCRSALAHLWNAGVPWDDDLLPVSALVESERSLILQQLQKNINSPRTSSVGRLFDAVSSLLGICQIATYEGQAAIELENTASTDTTEHYGLDFLEDQIDVSVMISEIVSDIRNGTDKSLISAKFHKTLALIVLAAAQKIQIKTGVSAIALSGGVWQNIRLLEGTIGLLEEKGFTVLWHHQVPTNDGCISLGQIMVASASNQKG